MNAILFVAVVLAADDFRQWSDATARYHVDARFVEYTGGNVTLAKRDGSTVSVPLEKLCKRDREAIVDMLPEYMATFIHRSREARKVAVADLAARIKRSRNRATTKDLAQELAVVKNPRVPYYATLPDRRPDIGMIGRCHHGVRLIQVLGDDTILAEIGARSSGRTTSIPLVQGSTVQRMYIPGSPSTNATIQVVGYPTVGMTLGTHVDLDGVFCFTTTTTYETVAGGTNTVLVMQLVDMTHYEVFFTD